MQQPKIWDAARIDDDGLAVQNQVLRRQGCDRIDGSDAERPVVAPPCVEGRLSVSEVRLRYPSNLISWTELPPEGGS